MKKTCKLYIDNSEFKFSVDGDFFWGKNEVLYSPDDSLISNTDWADAGYTVTNLFDSIGFNDLKENISNILVKIINELGIEIDSKSFTLEKYHEIIKTNEQHNRVINVTRNLTILDFDWDLNKLVKYFEKITGQDLTTYIKELSKTHIQIRISRPQSLDINPPHRDGYLSYYKDILNLWIPIAGCNEKSSLPLVPGSHLMPESLILRTEAGDAVINGNRYNVPCILETSKGPFRMVRPNPRYTQALAFTPFLIHGAAVNQNQDITRVSLELRLAKRIKG